MSNSIKVIAETAYTDKTTIDEIHTAGIDLFQYKTNLLKIMETSDHFKNGA